MWYKNQWVRFRIGGNDTRFQRPPFSTPPLSLLRSNQALKTDPGDVVSDATYTYYLLFPLVCGWRVWCGKNCSTCANVIRQARRTHHLCIPVQCPYRCRAQCACAALHYFPSHNSPLGFCSSNPILAIPRGPRFVARLH